jgi:thymidylate synthase (FAD)
MGSDLTVVNSARVSFGKRKTKLGNDDIKLIKYLAKNRHDSPFRHVYFQFHIKMPEFLARQMYKHIVGINYSEMHTNDHAWNEISGRYVDLGDVDMFTPTVFRKQSKDNKQASEGVSRCQLISKSVFNLTHLLSRLAYKFLIGLGVSREQARAILPLSFYTEFYWTASLQAACHFISLRNKAGAQGEIVEFANAIESLIRPIVPVSVESLLTRS